MNDLFIDTDDLMTDNDGDGMGEFCIVDRLRYLRLFQGIHRDACILQQSDGHRRVFHVCPFRRLLCTQRDLGDLGPRRSCSDATQKDLADSEAVSSSKDGTNIGETTDIVEDQEQVGALPLLAEVSVCSMLIDPSFSGHPFLPISIVKERIEVIASRLRKR